MKVAIMQPYVFPYIGYFQLIDAVDLFVIYDDVQYIKKGWINRNRILLNGKEHLFTIPCIKASQSKLINEIGVDWSSKDISGFCKTIEAAYRKAPFFEEINTLLHAVLNKRPESIADLATAGITSICDYLNIKTELKRSSQCDFQNVDLKKGDRLIDIVKKTGGSDYINAIGGRELYTKEDFAQQGINLNFLKSLPVVYQQFNNDFVPWLSILDVLMFNSKENIAEYLKQYELL
ncbi:WbqC family protein [Pontibacter sp. 172403-2]|uniref:WbqC family protein n=1 Tax=Pontibacter rufus TaxID=2791028 RepID=UPI0018AFC347|nr:WbqC family protein [Pontibacter sp. 172403-2]MBF9253844.1 WbqC family protein [Pontibacter sp. 172403-2]